MKGSEGHPHGKDKRKQRKLREKIQKKVRASKYVKGTDYVCARKS